MTYSIVAANTETQEVGGAGTSCLTGDDVYVIYRGVPGRGVVHAQAYYSLNARDRAAELLAQGATPIAVLEAVTLPSFDPKVAIRQYGVVDAHGASAGFTGTGTMPFASDRQGTAPPFAYSVQGNILTSAKVLEQAATAFRQSGCDLAEHLMVALEAGALDGQGDSRCTSQGIPSDSAFLQVESPGVPEGGYLSLHVESSGDENPLPLLRAKLDAWRVQHPCPVKAPAGSASVTQDGCGCRVTHPQTDDATGLLIGGLLIVAWWRKRAARQLGPIQTPR